MNGMLYVNLRCWCDFGERCVRGGQRMCKIWRLLMRSSDVGDNCDYETPSLAQHAAVISSSHET